MQYKVPQNIDQEDKILGPMTFTQFLYALIGGGLLLLFFALFDTSLFLLLGIPTLILTICFALIKVQDQPFSHFFVALILYILQPKRRVWRDQHQPADLASGLGSSFSTDMNNDLPDAVTTGGAKAKSKNNEQQLPPLPENISTSRKLAVKTAGNNIAAETITTGVTANITTAPTPTPEAPTKTPRKLQINVLAGGA